MWLWLCFAGLPAGCVAAEAVALLPRARLRVCGVVAGVVAGDDDDDDDDEEEEEFEEEEEEEEGEEDDDEDGEEMCLRCSPRVCLESPRLRTVLLRVPRCLPSNASDSMSSRL